MPPNAVPGSLPEFPSHDHNTAEIQKIFIKSGPVEPVPLAREISGSIDDSSSFVILNLDQVVNLYNNWRRELPDVTPFYAVKCNNDPRLLQLLVSLGCGFDCASQLEIDTVSASLLDHKIFQMLGLGVNPEKILFANTIKSCSSLRHSRSKGVYKMTFDGTDDLQKIKVHFPDAKLLLRIAITDATAFLPFERKFGMDYLQAEEALLVAKELGLNVIGVSFHVGSGSRDADIYGEAISQVRCVFNIGKELGFDMRIVDIGGGFPGNNSSFFRKMAQVIRHAVGQHFSKEQIEVIAEPGRYFATTTSMTVAQIIHSRMVPASHITGNASDICQPGFMYFINDSVHSSMRRRLRDHQVQSQVLLTKAEAMNQQEEATSIVFGNTCDPKDVVEDSRLMPLLKTGDWLYYENVGAYSTSLGTNFNGFPMPQIYAFISEENWKKYFKN